MYAWMNAGPGPLDLTTPMAEGFKEGLASRQESDEVAYRKQQVSLDQQRIDNMNQALGLQQKTEQFREDQWSSQADMRATDLDLAQQALKAQTMAYTNQANDKAALLDGHGTLDTLAAKRDFLGISNATPPPGMTSAGMQAWEQMKAGYLQGAASTQALAQTNATAATTLQYSQLFGKPLTNPDGTPDVAGMSTALTQRELNMKKTEAENSASVMGAQMRAQASMYGANTRAAATTTAWSQRSAGAMVNGLVAAHQKAQQAAGGTLPPAEEADWQQQLQQARGLYQGAGQLGATGQSGGNVPAQTAPVNNAPSQINGLLQRSFQPTGPAPGAATASPTSATTPSAGTPQATPQTVGASAPPPPIGVIAAPPGPPTPWMSPAQVPSSVQGVWDNPQTNPTGGF